VPGSLAARDISKSYAAVQVLDRVSLVVGPRDRVGILGPNGIGKSTLLRVLAGLEDPDRGRIVRSGTVGYLPQEPGARPGETVLAYLARRTGVGEVEAEMDRLASRLGHEPELAAEYGDALDRFLAFGGEDFEARAGAALADVGLQAEATRAMSSLSGGEAARAGLAAILLARFDVFLLDEPTNNLDFAGLERLERFLDGLAAGVVLVSHDRAFLDRTVTRVVELEAETRRMHEYAGTWSEYAAARQRARAQHEREYAGYVDERERYSALLTARRGQATALGTTQTGRRATNALRSKVRQAKNLLEGLDEVEKPWSPWQLRLELPNAPKAGLIAALDAVVAERGTFRLGPISLELHWGDRVAIVGANGSGKSTLLEVLLGDLTPSAGTRRVGSSVVFGELNQARDRFTGALLADFVAATGLEQTEARTLLAKFALGADDVEREASRLSPGERTRAGLALLAARGVNCLVLDEPTNHLDLEAIEELECALETYDGCLLVVTHDRRFLEQLSVTRTISM
jgi:ATPase subunit of ABC transporter with duplicated ATPase domains